MSETATAVAAPTPEEEALAAVIPSELLEKAGDKDDGNGDGDGYGDMDEEQMKKLMGSKKGQAFMEKYMKEKGLSKAGDSADSGETASALSAAAEQITAAANDLSKAVEGIEPAGEDGIDAVAVFSSFGDLAKAVVGMSQEMAKAQESLTSKIEELSKAIDDTKIVGQSTGALILSQVRNQREAAAATAAELEKAGEQGGVALDSGAATISAERSVSGVAGDDASGAGGPLEKASERINRFVTHYGGPKQANEVLTGRLEKARAEGDGSANELLGYIGLARNPKEWAAIDAPSAARLPDFLGVD